MRDLALRLEDCQTERYDVLHLARFRLLVVDVHPDELVLLLDHPLNHFLSHDAIAASAASAEYLCAASPVGRIAVEFVPHLGHVEPSLVHKLVERGPIHLVLAEALKRTFQVLLRFYFASLSLTKFFDVFPNRLDLSVLEELVVLVVEEQKEVKRLETRGRLVQQARVVFFLQPVVCLLVEFGTLVERLIQRFIECPCLRGV